MSNLKPLTEVLREAANTVAIKDLPKLLQQAANRIEDLEAEVTALKLTLKTV